MIDWLIRRVLIPMFALDETIDSPNYDTCKMDLKRTAEAIQLIQRSNYSLGFHLAGANQSIRGVAVRLMKRV